MKNILIILAIGLAIMFSGCSGKVQKVNVVKQYKYINLPKHYYTDDIIVAQLPSKKVYKNASPIKRDKINTRLIIRLYKNIGEYKNKLKAINLYEYKVNELVNEKDIINLKELKEIIGK